MYKLIGNLFLLFYCSSAAKAQTDLVDTIITKDLLYN
jgi:hypothetical protein